MQIKLSDPLNNVTQAQTSGEVIEILASDGRPLYHLRMRPGSGLEISASMVCKDGEDMLDTALQVRPLSANAVEVSRVPYKPD